MSEKPVMSNTSRTAGTAFAIVSEPPAASIFLCVESSTRKPAEEM